MRCRSPYLSVPTVFKTESQAVVIISPFIRPICQRTFSFELRIGIEPISPDYKSGASPSMLTKQYKTKNPNCFESGSYIPFYFC